MCIRDRRTHPYDVRASCTHLHPLLTCSYTTIHHLPRTRTAMPPCASSHVYVYTRINTPSSHSSCNKPRLYTLLLRHGARGSSLTYCGAVVYRATCTDEHTIPLRKFHTSVRHIYQRLRYANGGLISRDFAMLLGLLGSGVDFVLGPRGIDILISE